MKKYEKPGISVMRLLQEERIAASFEWIWNGDGPSQDQVDSEYQKYLLENGIQGFSNGDPVWSCGFDVTS